MPNWLVDEPDGTMEVWTESKILSVYWAYWSNQMLRVGRSPMITEQNCIDDFVTVHWATRMED